MDEEAVVAPCPAGGHAIHTAATTPVVPMILLLIGNPVYC